MNRFGVEFIKYGGVVFMSGLFVVEAHDPHPALPETANPSYTKRLTNECKK